MFLLSAGCAWGYAGQQEEEQTEESEGDEDPNVVVQESENRDETPDGTEGDSNRDAGSSAGRDNASACGVETFEVHYYDDSNQMTKEIDCASRKVVTVKRSPISEEELQSADRSGLPEGTWYLLVDPKGARSTFLNNDQLIRISQEYDLQFLGRDKQRNLLIYEYRGDL